MEKEEVNHVLEIIIIYVIKVKMQKVNQKIKNLILIFIVMMNQMKEILLPIIIITISVKLLLK